LGLWGGLGGGIAGAAILAAALIAFFLRRRNQAISQTGAEEAEPSTEGTGVWEVEHPDEEFIEEENPFASSDDLGAVQNEE
jgi:hypothetical protein